MRAGNRIRNSLLLTIVVFDLLLGIAPASAEQLPVPPNLVAPESNQGEQLLFNAEARRAYFPLFAQFLTQENQGFCGIASLVMVLNALHVPAPDSAALKPFSAFDQSNVFNTQTEKVLPRAIIEKKGMTLDQFGGIAAVWGLKAEIYHAADSSLEEFRQLAGASLDADNQHVVVILLLDVARYKYPPVWVSSPELFAAMNTPDSDNENLTRGYVILTR